MASVSIRHVILGVESRKERAGSDYKVWRAPGNAKFARNSGMRRREIAREASMERSKDAPHQPEATSKTRTFCGELETLETICIRTVHVGLPANARKQTMAPPSNRRR